MTNIPLAIIGGGVAACTAAIYAARAGHTPTVYVGFEQPGGDLTTTTTVENFPGYADGIEGPDLIENMKAQAEKFGAVFVFDEVTALDVENRTLTLQIGGEVSYEACIITTGSEYNKLGLEGEDELVGRGLSYCATCDGPFFAGYPVVVVGGGDSACEEALFLTKYASSVTMLVRGDDLRASAVMAERVENHPSIDIRYGYKMKAYHVEDGAISGVVALNPYDDHWYCEANGVFVAIGSSPRTGLVAGQVALDDEGYIRTSRNSSAVLSGTRSNAGLFAAGDVIDPTYRQAVVAAGSGAKAGMDAAAYLDALNQV